MEEYFIMTNDQFKSGIKLEEYQGVYSLVNAYQDKEGKIKSKWCYIEAGEKNESTGKWESKPGKKLPQKIELGMQDTAIEKLKQLLLMLDPTIEFGKQDVPF